MTEKQTLKKDNKLKINSDELEFLKQIPIHQRDRLTRKIKKRRSKCVMPTGALLAAGKTKRKYARAGKMASEKSC